MQRNITKRDDRERNWSHKRIERKEPRKASTHTHAHSRNVTVFGLKFILKHLWKENELIPFEHIVCTLTHRKTQLCQLSLGVEIFPIKVNQTEKKNEAKALKRKRNKAEDNGRTKRKGEGKIKQIKQMCRKCTHTLKELGWQTKIYTEFM